MAAVTAAVVGVAAVGLTAYGMQQQKKANQRAAKLNEQDALENARLTEEQAAEDARVFRLSFRRDNERNKAAIGASGIKMEGSPLEVLQDNAAMAEQDVANIKRGAMNQRDAYFRQARMFKEGGQAQARAADIGTAAAVLQGASNAYSGGRQSGAWS